MVIFRPTLTSHDRNKSHPAILTKLYGSRRSMFRLISEAWRTRSTKPISRDVRISSKRAARFSLESCLLSLKSAGILLALAGCQKAAAYTIGPKVGPRPASSTPMTTPLSFFRTSAGMSERSNGPGP